MGLRRPLILVRDPWESYEVTGGRAKQRPEYDSRGFPRQTDGLVLTRLKTSI